MPRLCQRETSGSSFKEAKAADLHTVIPCLKNTYINTNKNESVIFSCPNINALMWIVHAMKRCIKQKESFSYGGNLLEFSCNSAKWNFSIL